MGCDGGTIPRRDELVKTKKKPEQKDKDSELRFRWRHCSIKQDALQKPIVTCELGRLYNKVSVLESLLDKSSMPVGIQHIRSLKDVKELNLTENPEWVKKSQVEKGDAYIDSHLSQYICPVVGIEMNGKYKFICLWSCGCVMSERALKAVKTNTCHKCGKSFTDEDVVILNAVDEDLDLMHSKMAERRERMKKAKGEKKTEAKSDKKRAAADAFAPGTSKMSKMEKKESFGSSVEKSGITKVLSRDPAFEKVKSSYSIAKDPQASSTYKSLFTSHPAAQTQDKAHWVTHNPFYN